MKHLGHQNRKQHVYDGDMLLYRGTMGDLWGVMVAIREAKKGEATNLQARAGAGRPQGDRRETARRPQGDRRDGARRP